MTYARVRLLRRCCGRHQHFIWRIGSVSCMAAVLSVCGIYAERTGEALR